MKKLLLVCLLFVGQNAFAQDQHHDQIVEAVVARNAATNTTITGQLYFFKQQTGKRSAFSGILFGEQDNHKQIDIVSCVGPAFSAENITVGVMLGGAVGENQLSLCVTPWVYAQSKNRKVSLLAFSMIQKRGVTFMIEGLMCVYTWKEFEIACGGINIRDYLGPYLRISSGSTYFGINVAFKCLPNTSFKHEESELTHDAKIYHATEGNNGYFVQGTFGKEIFSPRSGNRCKDCD